MKAKGESISKEMVLKTIIVSKSQSHIGLYQCFRSGKWNDDRDVKGNSVTGMIELDK